MATAVRATVTCPACGDVDVPIRTLRLTRRWDRPGFAVLWVCPSCGNPRACPVPNRFVDRLADGGAISLVEAPRAVRPPLLRFPGRPAFTEADITAFANKLAAWDEIR